MVVRQQSLGNQVADELRLKIFSGGLPSKTPLIESTLSKEFGVSRGPVRDAISQLEGDGIVFQDGRSFYVHGDIGNLVTELYELRYLLECRAIRLALKNNANWEVTTEILEEFRQAALDGRDYDARDADFRFHQSFFLASGARLATNMWSICERNFKALLTINDPAEHDLTAEFERHKDLFNAIRNDDHWEQKLLDHFDIASARYAVRSNQRP